MFIANQSLHIDQLKKEFSSQSWITIADLDQFYKQFDQQVKRSTIHWRVYELKQKGVLNKVQRGVYSLSDVNYYQPTINASLKKLFGTIQNQFPLVDFCLWSTKWLNEFMTHQPGQFYTIVEVEKEATTSVFYWLKEQRRHVFLDPDEKEIDQYVGDRKNPIIVIPLISESPLQTVNNTKTVTLEKILVDIVANETLFNAQQGRELKNIYKGAFEKYTISQNKLLRYANRRNRGEKVEKLIGLFSKKRQ